MKITENIKIALFAMVGYPCVTVVDINLTTRCNQRCVYCEIGQGMLRSERDLLNLEDLKWVVNQMTHDSIPALVLLGGEPFLFKDIFNLLEYASHRIPDITIITNGMRIPGLSESEVALLKRSGCTMIVSLDSFHPETNNRIRGVDNACECAIKAIQILLKNQIPVQIETVISRYNYHEIARIVKDADALGVSSVRFVPVITTSNFPAVQSISDKDTLNPKPDHISILEEEFQEILAYERDHIIETNIRDLKGWMRHYIAFHAGSSPEKGSFFNYRLKRLFCWNLYSRIKINASGQVQPCNLIPSTVTLFDNPGRSLLETWNVSCRQIRTSMKSEMYPRQCNDCYSQHSLNTFLSAMRYPLSNRAGIREVLRAAVQQFRR